MSFLSKAHGSFAAISGAAPIVGAGVGAYMGARGTDSALPERQIAGGVAGAGVGLAAGIGAAVAIPAGIGIAKRIPGALPGLAKRAPGAAWGALKSGAGVAGTLGRAATGIAGFALRHPMATTLMALTGMGISALASSGASGGGDPGALATLSGTSSTGVAPGMGAEAYQDARQNFMDSASGLTQGLHRGRHG